MNAEETGRLVAIIASVCPQQPIVRPEVAPDGTVTEPGTAAYWWPLLEDVRFMDARDAVKRLARKRPFIGVSEIIDMVAAIRAERLDALPEVQRPVPAVDPSDAKRWAAAKREIERAIADGDIVPDGQGSYALSAPVARLALDAGPSAGLVSKGEIDFAAVFQGPRTGRAALTRAEREAEQAARAAELAERERQLALLNAMIGDYEEARRGKLTRKRQLSKKKAKSLVDSRADGATLDGPQVVRDATAS